MLTTMLLVFGQAAMEKALIAMLVIFIAGGLIIAFYEAWTKRRGVLGWVVNVVAAVIGGIFGGAVLGGAALALGGLLRDHMFPKWAELDATMGLPALIIGIVLGARLTLKLVNRFR